jgi:glutamyl-tRNA synthetase
MRTLAARALAYPSDLTRAEIEAAASAPQEGAHDTPFPPHLRPPLAPLGFNADAEATNWRFAVAAGPVAFSDALAGPQRIDVSQTVGDFVIWTKRAQPAYQLAVVVDDHRQRITQVIRGDDLLDSAARQLLLFRALGLAPEPTYTHLPLVRGPDGRRLAKRHGDTRIDHYRALGVPPEAVIGLIAHWSIPDTPREPLSAAGFKDRFELSRMPAEPVTFLPEDDQWLRSFT